MSRNGIGQLEDMNDRRSAGVNLAADDPHATLASSVYDDIRSDILCAVLRPGAKLRMDSLRDRYATGASPIREALNRLAGEDLVILSDKRGFSVPPVSVEEAAGLIDSRLRVNDMVLRDAIGRGGQDWEEAIVVANYRLGRLAEYRDDGSLNPEWIAAHLAVQAALVARSALFPLRRFDAVLAERLMRYRSLPASGDRQPDDASAWASLVEATLDRDADAAQARFSAALAALGTFLTPEVVAANQQAPDALREFEVSG